MTATDNVRPVQGAPEMTRAQTIAQLNDAFRKGQAPGRFFVTPGVIRLSQGAPDELIALVRSFDTFNADNDPHGEHDFGAIDWHGQRIFWKVDGFDHDLKYASPDPTDESVTTRVMTIMLASEY
jgi:hypothetical protein